jgi:site-specific DNA recombinase
MAEELGVTLRRTYTDNDLSAYSGVERPEYQRLLADIAAGQIRTLIFWHANLFLRNTDECNSFIRLVRKHGLRVVSYTKGGEYRLDRATGRRELRDDVNASQYESEHRGERVALARKRQARQGPTAAGSAPTDGAWTPGGCGRCAATRRPRRWNAAMRTGRCWT